MLGLDGLASAAASPSATTEARMNTPSVPAACLACRGKHLKCDGQTPCSRCTSSNTDCVYVASRRGYKGPRRGTARNPNKRRASSPARESSSSVEGGPMMLGCSSGGAMSSSIASSFNPSIVLPENSPGSPFIAAAPSPNCNAIYQSYGGTVDTSNLILTHHSTNVPAQVPVPTPSERCLDSFYHHFHAAHPFVLPKEYLLRIAKEGAIAPLLAATRWLGSLYIEAGPTRASFFEEAYRLAYEPGRPKDGFLVQAMLLLIIGLDGSCQQEKAREILADVERISVQIGLNTRPFASLNGRGNPVLEESWRRTWWDLYVVDAMIAGVHRTTNFLLFDVAADVALPCEEYQYLSGHIPQSLYLEDMEDCDFSGEDREFSSFAYRIQCARNLGKFMRVPPIFGPEDENLSRIEALLTNWRLHLPEAKRDAIYKDGRLDEMMFQAHMMMHATSILLHQPHSQLDSSPTRSVNSCAPHASVPSGDSFNAHTKHTIQAANEISKLVTHRVPLLSHSHFFACVVTLSSIVHLSKWALFFVPHNDDNLRQQIRLNIGALAKLSQVWTCADRASGQVKGVAQEVYRVKKQSQLTPQYWLGLTQEEVMNSIATDESIISEIENMHNIPTMPNLMG
ncbi:hypothetical protein BGZ61DRAFT_354119 [Ilyonectria robusta]|uniref:uncharacterized protein n=1 Tax=Ilyonectria robusta TaxID=1079257 RepID=UPI001E8EDCE0|nr:uncharacterized protein BGZ61DRAFT_354119 [Ilyonectria robusta]KAH8686904.1 hypothetical protein BGZ61DRAFT_354119 [Ilyonectria robusta]